MQYVKVKLNFLLLSLVHPVCHLTKIKKRVTHNRLTCKATNRIELFSHFEQNDLNDAKTYDMMIHMLN